MFLSNEAFKNPLGNRLFMRNDLLQTNENGLAFSWYKGVVVPIMWDELERPVQYGLFMKDDELILTSLGPKVKLANFLNKKVFVYGKKVDEDILGYEKINLAGKKKLKLVKEASSIDLEEYPLHINLP